MCFAEQPGKFIGLVIATHTQAVAMQGQGNKRCRGIQCCEGVSHALRKNPCCCEVMMELQARQQAINRKAIGKGGMRGIPQRRVLLTCATLPCGW